MNYSACAKPILFDSQLKFRLGLAKKRLEHYPLDSMNFVMMDLERPPLRSREAHWCSYDLTGRTLLFYSLADGIDGSHIDRLPELFERIMQCRRPSGTFGSCYGLDGRAPEDAPYFATQFVSGLVAYYELTGDMRALSAAREHVDFFLSRGDEFFRALGSPNGPHRMVCWVPNGLADLYRVTKDKKYYDAVVRIVNECVGEMRGAHSHGYLTTLRGILKMAIYSGDGSLAEFVRVRRQEMLDSGCVSPTGDICECLPASGRNEGCSIGDWILLNLIYAHYYGDDGAYAIAEHTLWNAFCFNQFITGGFGHRFLSKTGYKTQVEEAWWCCTQTCGMTIAAIARHAVTVKGGELKLNFLIPGKYTLPGENGEITVSVSTMYPVSAEAVITVEGTKSEIKLRLPDFIKGASVTRTDTDFGYALHLTGRMGHYTEKHGDGAVLKYGPMVIAPMIYNWDGTAVAGDNTVPDGYTHDSGEGADFTLLLGEPDKDGFYELPHDPIPAWSVFEEGRMASISGGEVASARVKVLYPSGETKELFFHPLLSSTTNLTLMDIPTVFGIKSE